MSAPKMMVRNGVELWLRPRGDPFQKPTTGENSIVERFIAKKHQPAALKALEKAKTTGEWDVLAGVALQGVLREGAENVGWLTWPIETPEAGAEFLEQLFEARIRDMAANETALRGGYAGVTAPFPWIFGHIPSEKWGTFLEDEDSDDEKGIDSDVTIRSEIDETWEKLRAMKLKQPMDLLVLPSWINLMNYGDGGNEDFFVLVPGELTRD